MFNIFQYLQRSNNTIKKKTSYISKIILIKSAEAQEKLINLTLIKINRQRLTIKNTLWPFDISR